jgi:hypothetical protein
MNDFNMVLIQTKNSLINNSATENIGFQHTANEYLCLEFEAI